MTRYVILRDDDANGTTSPEAIERLYRPFLARGWPVCLAVIPEVRTDVRTMNGELEGFVDASRRGAPGVAPIADNRRFVDYVRAEPKLHVVQHGLRHEIVGGRFEFDRDDARDVATRMDAGSRALRDAGFPKPSTFVAPQDQISRTAVRAALARYAVLSTGYYSLRRLPRRHWARYLIDKRVSKRPHVRLRSQTLLTHPGCILSPHREPEHVAEAILAVVRSQRLTVVVSHHWEYASGGGEPSPLVDVLHSLPERFEAEAVRVVTFDEARSFV